MRDQLRRYLKSAVEIGEDKPVLVDKYIVGKEVEVDAICDGTDVFVPGIMELVERTGSPQRRQHQRISALFSIIGQSKRIRSSTYAKKLGLAIGIVGLYNIQFIVDKDERVYIIEVNPRSSRTVPFLSKATGYSLADIATRGHTRQDHSRNRAYSTDLSRREKAPVRKGPRFLLLKDTRT